MTVRRLLELGIQFKWDIAIDDNNGKLVSTHEEHAQFKIWDDRVRLDMWSQYKLLMGANHSLNFNIPDKEFICSVFEVRQ
jgi:hypothetical protein